MATLRDQITSAETTFSEEISAATSLDALEKVRIAFLGRKGQLGELMTQLKQLSPDEKRVLGPVLQKFKAAAQAAYDAKKAELEAGAARGASEQLKDFDVTAYRYQAFTGGLHIYTEIIEELTRIFISMGYEVADGPEVESDYYNFEALNIPADHPARDMQDTFWLKHFGMLLRTHTSPVQVRYMESHKPPLAVVVPGRVYRHEETDATHDFVFTQLEGLLVGKDISMGNLLATARAFLRAIFGKSNIGIRVRPGYFPFVEPGVEIDMSCPFCTVGCSVCKRTRWIELLGAGLVHPNVLRAVNIDPTKYSGFAFGMGIERLAMVKYGINDVRLFHSSKLAFLQQF